MFFLLIVSHLVYENTGNLNTESLFETGICENPTADTYVFPPYIDTKYINKTINVTLSPDEVSGHHKIHIDGIDFLYNNLCIRADFDRGILVRVEDTDYWKTM
jgi:hypothetical protein